MFGLLNKGRIEKEMAEWLAHPMEFGVAPESVRYRKTHKTNDITQRKVEIHVVDYKMPDGTKGRGFVNGSLTWSFLGDKMNAISDEDLFLAYCGWAWLFPAMQGETVLTDFVSAGEEAMFADSRRSDGVTDFRITGRYKFGDSELFEYDGLRGGIKVKGAGGLEGAVEFPSSDPRFFLPSIYFLLGQEVIAHE